MSIDLSSLPPRTRTVVEMAQAGISYKEIAARLGVSIQAVYSHVSNGRKKVGGWFRTRGRPADGEDYGSDETPRDARARVAAEIAEGKRCTHPLRRGPCSLLLPCADHGQ